MNKRKIGILAVMAVLALCIIVVALVGIPLLIAERSAVPFQTMPLTFADEDGAATIRSDAFRITFAGHSFGSHIRGGDYVVDGRYGYRLFGGPESTRDEISGVSHEYSQRRRLLTFEYQGHKITYSHALNKLTVDGHDFSTADGQVRILIKANGEVERVGR